MIVVDASFALNLVLNEPTSPAVRPQWQRWAESGELVIAVKPHGLATDRINRAT